MARQHTKAVKCRHRPCNNTVRLNNPSFPYCNKHVGLKHRKTRLTDSFFHRLGKHATTFFTRPPKGFVHSKTVTGMMIRKHSGGLKPSTVKAILNITPHDVLTADEAKQQQQHYNIQLVGVLQQDPNTTNVRLGEAKHGVIAIPGGGFHTAPTKQITLYESDGDVFVADLTAQAALPDGAEPSRMYRSGENWFTDTCVIEHVGDYGLFGPVRWSSIVDEYGETVWENTINNHDDGVQEWRDNIRRATNLVFPQPEQFVESPRINTPNNLVGEKHLEISSLTDR